MNIDSEQLLKVNSPLLSDTGKAELLSDFGNSALSDSLEKVGLISMANRHRLCHKQYLVFARRDWVTDDIKIVKTSCDVKGCPLCNYRKSNRLWGRLIDIAIANKRNIVHLVLTKKHVVYPDKNEIALFSKQINLFLKHYGVGNYKQKNLLNFDKRPKRQFRIRGVLIAFESIPKENGYHLHAHLILITRFLHNPIGVWSDILGYHANLKIMGYARKKDSVVKKLVSYVTRYAVKNVIQHSDPDKRAEMILAQYHQRMVRTRGLFFKAPDRYIPKWYFLGITTDFEQARSLVMFIYGNIFPDIYFENLKLGADYG